jgi:hypothetical protein
MVINPGDVVKVKGSKSTPIKYVTEVRTDWGVPYFCWWPVVKRKDKYYIDKSQAGYTMCEKITKKLDIKVENE